MAIHQEGNFTGTREGHAHVPKGKPSRKKTDLAEQRLLAGTQEEKGEFSTFGKKGSNLGGLTRVLWSNAGRKLAMPKFN